MSLSVGYIPSILLLTAAADLVEAAEEEAAQFPTTLFTAHQIAKKAADPVFVPSYPSGLMSKNYPLYLRGRQAKRHAERPASWHLGKRAPWTLERSSWVANLFKPSTSKSAPGKRSLSAWALMSPWVGSKNSAEKRGLNSMDRDYPQIGRPDTGKDVIREMINIEMDDPQTDQKRNPYSMTGENLQNQIKDGKEPAYTQDREEVS